MKRFFTVLSLALASLFVACGVDSSGPAEDDGENVVITTTIKGITDITHQGFTVSGLYLYMQGKKPVTEVGAYAVTDSGVETKATSDGTQTPFTVVFSDLTPQTNYTVSCYVVVNGVTYPSKSFKVTTTEYKEPPVEPVILFYDNLDKELATQTYGSGNSWPYLDQFTGFVNATGVGVTKPITYLSSYTTCRNNYNSTGSTTTYKASASGGNNILFSRAESGFLSFGPIALTSEQVHLCFSFGCTSPSNTVAATANDFQLSISNDGSNFVNIPSYVRASNTTWDLATACFALAKPQTAVWIKFTCKTANVRVDDLKLSTADAGDCTQTVELPHRTTYVGPWAELPKINTTDANWKQTTYWAETIKTKQKVRNYTTLYDTRRHNPMYVAALIHPCYSEGGYARTDPDPWRPAPELTDDQQSIIYRADWNDWPWSDGATYNYSFWGPCDGKFFGRGHMLSSSARGGAQSLLNIQTFYPTNISPEAYRNYRYWEIVEMKSLDNWTCSDTLYMICGNYYGDASKTVYDACAGSDRSDLSKLCEVPTARYKVFMRTKSGVSGKALAECTADEVQAIGFWFEQAMTDEQVAYDETATITDIAFTVNEIEQKIGNRFSFFPTAPQAAKGVKDLSLWPTN